MKAALFLEGNVKAHYRFNSAAELSTWLSQLSGVKSCIIASVTNAHLDFLPDLQKRCHTILFNANTPVPLLNLYKSAATLGSDRLAVAIGANTLMPHANVLSIDAGTCVKYNFVNQLNEYLGGAISPGIAMRLNAMHHFTAALPMVDFNQNYSQTIGRSTTESILSGALVATACEIDGMINRYIYDYPDLHVYITGGDAEYLCKQVKSRFFANPDLLMIGLNTILEFNDKT